MQDSWDWTALMHAADKGHPDCVRLLLEKEAGMRDRNGVTALMVAAYWNSLKCVRLLAEKEKDMRTTCEWDTFPPGSTALDIAKREGYKEIASILGG